MGIRASAGGLRAVNQCFEHTSNDYGMALSLFSLVTRLSRSIRLDHSGSHQNAGAASDRDRRHRKEHRECHLAGHNLLMTDGYPLATLWDQPPPKTRSLRWTYGIADAPLAGRHFLGIFCNVAHSLDHEEVTSVWRDNDLGTS